MSTLTTKNTNPGEVVVDLTIDQIFKNQHEVKSVSTDQVKLKSTSDLSELEALWDSRIDVKQLQMPQGLNLQVKRREFAYRWVNFKSHGGENYSKFKYNGWQNATKDDVTPTNDKALASDGSISFGDLILMKLPREMYLGIIKANYIRSNVHLKRISVENLHEQAEQLDQSIIGGDVAASMLKTFRPSSKDVAQKLQNNNSPLK